VELYGHAFTSCGGVVVAVELYGHAFTVMQRIVSGLDQNRSGWI
jgi:hypothetical protein